jgi:hypothetical protein
MKSRISRRRLHNLIWHRCGRPEFTVDSIEISSGRCTPQFQPANLPCAPEHAVLGDDGLFHFVTKGRLTCHFAGEHAAMEHRVARCGAVGGFPTRRWRGLIRWDPAPVSGPVDLLSVHPELQCPVPTSGWPGSLTGDGSRNSRLATQVRRVLVKKFGHGCMTCPNPWAAVIDHEHLTGHVRGYLCRDCNVRVDACSHPDDCPYADYLNAPPAATLGLVHPQHQQRMRQAGYRRRRDRFDRIVQDLGLEN